MKGIESQVSPEIWAQIQEQFEKIQSDSGVQVDEDYQKELEQLFELYKDKNFTIVGFPCNQFNEQDPGTGAEIKEFCTRNYGVSFLIMDKVNVKGDSISEIYNWLTSKEKNGVMNSSVKWNFQKYMIDENGFLVDYLFSFKKPNCKKIVSWIEKNN